MSPGLQLILACLLLSATITYAWWTKLRVLLLQLDLAAIRQDFQVGTTAMGRQDDESSHDFLEALDALIDGADGLSASVIGPISRLTDGDPRGILGPDAEPFLCLLFDSQPKPAELDWAMRRVYLRLARYLVLESLSGWMLIFKALVTDLEGPSSVARGQAQESRESMETWAFAALLSRGDYRRTA